MKIRPYIAVVGLLLSAGVSRAQYPVFDIQSLIQLQSLYNSSNSQLNTLGSVLNVNTQTLQTAQRINSVLGQPGGLSNLLRGSSLYDLQGLVRQIPGLEGVNVNELFPPNVAGAFLGKTFGQWQAMIANPSTLLAQELRRATFGGMVTSGSMSSDEARFAQYMTNRQQTKDLGANALYLATTFSKLLTARILSSQEDQAKQQAAYAAQKEKLAEVAQNDNLTILDRSKLANNQRVLDLEVQLNAIQAQNLSNADQSLKLDTQTRLMEQQLMREEMDRAARR